MTVAQNLGNWIETFVLASFWISYAANIALDIGMLYEKCLQAKFYFSVNIWQHEERFRSRNCLKITSNLMSFWREDSSFLRVEVIL